MYVSGEGKFFLESELELGGGVTREKVNKGLQDFNPPPDISIE